MALDAREAIERAFQYAKELYSEDVLKNPLLEEIEYHDSGEEWHVTIGFDTGKQIKRVSGPSLMGETTYEPERTYKDFVIDAKTGTMKKMLRAN